MKLDVNALRYLSKDDFRVLTSVEMGQKNHEIVPLQLIDSISGLKHGGAFKCIKVLLRHKLLHHDGSTYDGYRLTNMGYDYLAIRALLSRGHISGVGRQIGVGKESDIFEVTNDEGETFALKLHRLGRTSFRAVKNQRDYLGKRQNFSWLYLSRLAALKEYAFMRALGEHGFPVPQALDNNRHAVLMTLLSTSKPLVQYRKLQNPAQVYITCMELISRLASKGLVHCDFNEFNLLINEETEEVTVIDFPQMVSVSHANAKELFERDVECIIRFFTKKIGYMPEQDPTLPYIRPSFETSVAEMDEALDIDLAASGFQRQHQKALDEWLTTNANDAEDEEEGEEEDEGEEGEERVEDEEGQKLEQGQQLLVDEQEREAVLESTQGGETISSHEDGALLNAEAIDAEEEEEEDEEEGEEDGDGEASELRRREPGARTRDGPASTITLPMGEREVQQILVNQRKKQQKRESMARASASKNSSKVSRKGGKASGGSTGASFGGW